MEQEAGKMTAPPATEIKTTRPPPLAVLHHTCPSAILEAVSPVEWTDVELVARKRDGRALARHTLRHLKPSHLPLWLSTRGFDLRLGIVGDDLGQTLVVDVPVDEVGSEPRFEMRVE